MKTRIILDMDGTIVDLYGRANWLEDIRSEKKMLFRNLEELEETKGCNVELEEALINGSVAEIVVATWTPYNVSPSYIKQVAQEKKDWIREEDFEFVSDILIMPYGTPKSEARCENYLNILFDDNVEIRKEFEEHKNCLAFEPKDIFRVLEILKER